MSILLSVLTLGLLAAVIVFLQAVNGAPDAEQSEAGFVAESGLQPKLIPVDANHAQANRAAMHQLGALRS